MNLKTTSILARKLVKLIPPVFSDSADYKAIVETIDSFSSQDAAQFLVLLNKDHDLLARFLNVLTILSEEDIDLDEMFIDLLGGEHKEARDIESWLLAALEDSESHFEQFSPGRDIPESLWLSFSGSAENGEITVSILQKHPDPAGLLIWDKASFKTDNGALTAISIVGYGLPVFFGDTYLTKVWKPKPMYQYFPERYRQSRDYVDAAPEICRKSDLPGRGKMNEEKINVIAGLIQTDLNRTNASIPLRSRRGQSVADMSDAIGNELSSYILYDSFLANGRKIFDINPTLVELFQNTDVDGIPVDSIVSPFETYYLYFGKQRRLKYKSGWYFDGAYVSHYPERKVLSIAFTFCPDVIEDVRKWTCNLEPRISISFSDAHFSMNLDEAVKNWVNEYLSELEKKSLEGDKDITEDLIEASEDLAFAKGMRVVHNAASNAEIRINRLAHERDILHDALNLVVNSMCYLSSYADDIELDWVAGTPKTMIEKARKGHPTIKKTTESKLNSMGYRRIYMCGRSLNTGPVDESDSSSKHKNRTHWRRGHWRQQACGVNREERRQVLIKPVIVNPNVSPENTEGSIYIDKKIIDLNKVKKSLKIKNSVY